MSVLCFILGGHTALQRVSIYRDADKQDDKPKWTNFPVLAKSNADKVVFSHCSSNEDIRKRTSKIGSGKQQVC